MALPKDLDLHRGTGLETCFTCGKAGHSYCAHLNLDDPTYRFLSVTNNTNDFIISFEPAPDLKPLPAYDQVRESVIALPKKEQAQLYRWMYDALGCRR